MKNFLLSSILICACIIFSNCKKDDPDLTSDLEGSYIGILSTPTITGITGDVMITRIDNSHIRIKPITRPSDFDEWETELEFKSDSVTSTVPSIDDPRVAFITYIEPVGMVFNIDADSISFFGEKQE